jgi:hypothetical protein
MAATLCVDGEAVISIRKTLELGVTKSYQNAAAGHRAMTPRSVVAKRVGAGANTDRYRRRRVLPRHVRVERIKITASPC